jgi:2-keto-3-deoxygluconate permease
MAGLADYKVSLLLATIAPTLLGMILGNLFDDARNFLRPGIQLLLPFIGFSLGAAINLNEVKSACVEGILLSCIVIPIGGLITYMVDKRILRRPGYAGLSSCATGANAVAVPAAIALADLSWKVSAPVAATQLATASIIGAIVIPLSVGILMRHKNK